MSTEIFKSGLKTGCFVIQWFLCRKLSAEGVSGMIKKSRAAGFVVIVFVYLLAAFAGFFVYGVISGPFWLRLLSADIAATIVTFLFSVIFGNASVYDPYWSVQPIVILTAFSLGKKLTLLNILLLIAVWFWGVRLTANWAYTFHGLSYQDWRYTMLKEQTGRFYPFVNFFGIHFVPTLIVYGCILPAVFAAEYAFESTAGGVAFTVLSVLAAGMQGVADYQMQKFRREGSGGFIRTGLWKNARHPNYLGEILMWWGVALSVLCSAPQKWYLCAGAFLNTALFFAVSIPMAEKRQGKKPGFASYKAETHLLLPVKKHKKSLE